MLVCLKKMKTHGVERDSERRLLRVRSTKDHCYLANSKADTLSISTISRTCHLSHPSSPHWCTRNSVMLDVDVYKKLTLQRSGHVLAGDQVPPPEVARTHRLRLPSSDTSTPRLRCVGCRQHPRISDLKRVFPIRHDRQPWKT